MSESITPTRTYYSVFAALIALTLLTVGVSFLDLGRWHTMVGVLIGVVKASLVGLFFMHLLHSSKASWLAVLAGLFWVGILMVLTLTDYLSRPVLMF
jgi:cytochrome c oxidase subunit 4